MDAQEVASVVSAREIQAVAELLQISPEGLQKAITFKVTVSLWASGLQTKLCTRTWTELPCADPSWAAFPSLLLSLSLGQAWRGVISDPKDISDSNLRLLHRLFPLPGMLFLFSHLLIL